MLKKLLMLIIAGAISITAFTGCQETGRYTGEGVEETEEGMEEFEEGYEEGRQRD